VADVVVGAALDDLESVVIAVHEVRSNVPSKGAAGRSGGQRAESIEVGVGTLAKDESGGSVALVIVGDSVGLSSDNALGVVVDGEGHGGGDKGRASKKALGETHFGGGSVCLRD